MTFPVTESTLSAYHLGQFLREKYFLSANTSCNLYRTGMNHLYRIEDQEFKFVFRVYTHGWRTIEEIAEELRLLIHLNQNDVPVSYPIADKGGKLIQEFDAPEGKRYGVLFSYAVGEKLSNFSPEASYNLGIAMAKFHKAVEGFALDRVTYTSEVLLMESIHRTSSFFRETSPEMKFIGDLTNYLNNEWKSVNLSDVRIGAIHLDIWFDNVHFNKEGNVTIFDFDFCGNGLQCIDISYFLYQLFSTNPKEEDYRVKADKFLKGYESVIEINPEEKRIIPFVCLGVMLFYLSVQCDRYDTWSNIFLNKDHLKRFVGSLNKWIVFQGLNIK